MKLARLGKRAFLGKTYGSRDDRRDLLLDRFEIMIGPEVLAADGFLEANEGITSPLLIDFFFGPVVAMGWIGHGMPYMPLLG